MMSELDPNQACRRSAALRAFTLRPRDAVVISTDNAPYDWPPLAANPDPMTTEILQQQRIEWRSHPAREHTGRAMIGLVIIAGLTAVIFAGFGPWWALGACVVLLLSLHRFYFPSRFVIDEQGITAAFLLRSRSLRWQDIRRFVHDQNGGYLSTRSRASSAPGSRIASGTCLLKRRDPWRESYCLRTRRAAGTKQAGRRRSS